MKAAKVGIIGIEGKYGQWLKRFFEKLSCPVIGSDLETEITNQIVVEQAEVVIFSVWPRVTVKVIEEVVPFSRPEQLWLDITSLKEKPVEAMLKSKAEVIGLHPMCAPTVKSWRGQTVNICPVRAYKWLGWVLEILKQGQAKIQLVAPDEHDRQMTFVQGLPHAAQLVMATVLRKMNVDVKESLKFTSPVYRITWSLMGRILAQDPELYVDIQLLNPHIIAMLKTMEQEARQFREMIEVGDREKFLAEFKANSVHFGHDNLSGAFELFEHLIRLMVDLSEQNSITLQVVKDRPGILHQISGILAKANINLTSFHSFPLKESYRFLIGLDRKRNSTEVQAALREISEKTTVEVLP